MVDQITEIVIPILRSLQTDVADIKKAIRRIDARIASGDSHLAGFHSTSRWQAEALDELRGRIEALEADATDDAPSP